jgi:hypothetical protein
MPDLVILIPFAPNPKCDLDQQAAGLQAFFDQIDNHRIGPNVDAQITNVIVLHKGINHQCAAGDFVLLFAHGAQDDTRLWNNVPDVAPVTLAEATGQLNAIGAANTTRILFMCCFSALANHIAAIWKQTYRQQSTFGGDAAISNLYSSTRTQIYSICAALHQL